MKRISKIIAYGITGGVLLLGGAGCNKLKDFGDVNVNPNGSSEVLTSALITNVGASVGQSIGNSFALSIYAPGLYCQYFGEPNYPGNGIYALPQNNSTGTYTGILMDCQVIINKNTDDKIKGTSSVLSGGGNKNQEAFARTIKAYVFWQLTDTWGDLPYSEALKGGTNLTPKYDKQEDIYKGILSELADAQNKFSSGDVPLRGDVIFGGDTNKWKKFVNSLRMLVALRLSKRFPGPSEYAAQQFKAAFDDAAGHITDNADNFAINYPGGNYRNPWFLPGQSEDNGIAKTFTDLLNGLSDGRISAMAEANNTGAYVGVLYGLNTNSVSAANSKVMRPSFRQENSPFIMINAASIWLAKAEAMERGWITGDAKAAYNAGVTASFAQWGTTISSTYLTTGPANYDAGVGVPIAPGNTTSINTSTPTVSTTTPGANAATASKLARIALQQWIAFYPNGMQGWANWRRSEGINGVAFRGVPDIRPTNQALPNAGGQIVRRYVYGTTEYALNNTQLQAVLSTMPGGDKQTSRIWWDKQP
jgi:hypothetical protein